MNLFGILESFYAFLFTVFTFITSYLISYKLTLGMAEITLTNKELDFVWKKKPILRFQNNQSIKIKDITSWKYRAEFQYNYFKIYNPSKIITVMRLPNWSPEKDDFENFYFTFKKRIENLNKKREKKVETHKKKEFIIDKEAEYNRSNISKVLFFIYIFSGILGAKYVFNNWNSGKTNIGIVIFGILGCIFYISKYKKLGNNK